MIKLSEIPTTPPEHLDREEAEKETKHRAKRIGELQYLMKAQGRYSLLVVMQGMDASGKDGAVRRVFRYCEHSGVDVHAFKKPTDEEFAHDFLWRVHKEVPKKGMVKVFNRSHYEDVLIQRVHGWIDEERVGKRMAAINAFEDLLWFDNNTLVLKFYLHLSKDQQREELMERVNEKDKHWKHNDGDWEQREYWDEYRKCYEYAISHSSTPWHIIPVDSRWYRDYLMSGIVLEALEGLDMAFPELDSERFG